FTTATSVSLSMPATLPLNSRRSESFTRTSSAPSTTCALVSTTPSACTMNPEPMPCCGRRGAGPWKRRRNSLSGLSSSSSPPPPGFAPKGDWPRGEASFVAVMLTTAPLFASTIAAKSGSICVAPPEAAAPACGVGAVLPAAGTLAVAGGALALTGSSLVQPPASASAATANSRTLIRTGASIGCPLRARDGAASCAVSSRQALGTSAGPMQRRGWLDLVCRRWFLDDRAERTAYRQRAEHHAVLQIFR